MDKRTSSPRKRNGMKNEQTTARNDKLLITPAGRRIGFLYFKLKDVENDAEMFAAVCSIIVFLPSRVKARQDLGMLEMVGLSSYFERIPDGGEVPAYRIVFSDDGKVAKAVKIGVQGGIQCSDNG